MTISEEMSVTRLTAPRATTGPATRPRLALPSAVASASAVTSGSASVVALALAFATASVDARYIPLAQWHS